MFFISKKKVKRKLKKLMRFEFFVSFSNGKFDGKQVFFFYLRRKFNVLFSPLPIYFFAKWKSGTLIFDFGKKSLIDNFTFRLRPRSFSFKRFLDWKKPSVFSNF